LIKEIHL